MITWHRISLISPLKSLIHLELRSREYHRKVQCRNTDSSNLLRRRKLFSRIGLNYREVRKVWERRGNYSVWPEAFDFWFQLKRAGFDVRDSSLLLYSLPHLDNHIYFLYSDLRLKNLELIIDEQPNKWHQRRRVFLYSGGTFEVSSRLDTFLRWHSNQS